MVRTSPSYATSYPCWAANATKSACAGYLHGRYGSRKRGRAWTHRAFRPHSVGLLDDLLSAHVVTTGLVGAIRMVQDYKIKAHFVLAECPPSLFG
jgi:hypothetical protein